MTPPSLADLHAAFGRWLAFPEVDGVPCYDLVDVALAVVVANRMPADPLWLFIVAPPSSGKTEVLRALGAVPDVYSLSSLTPQTFASGLERHGVETSLLPRLSGKTVVLKDFGTVLSLHREARGELLAQLREIYDGSFVKEWGTGKRLDWTGKVGLLAGVTGVIDREYSLNAVLGERVLLYRPRSAAHYDLARRALAQSDTPEREERQRLRGLVAAFLSNIVEIPPPIGEPLLDGVVALATLAARARSPVLYDRLNCIELVPEPEAPGRLAKALAALARALAVVRGERVVSIQSYLTAAQVAQDSIPAPRRAVLEVVLGMPDVTTSAVGEAVGYPTTTARRYLAELAAVGLVERFSDGPGHADRWAPSGLLRQLLTDAKHPLGEHLTRNVGGVMVNAENSERIPSLLRLGAALEQGSDYAPSDISGNPLPDYAPPDISETGHQTGAAQGAVAPPELQAAILERGARLGWVRLPIASGRAVAAGEDGWRKFVAHATPEDLIVVLRLLGLRDEAERCQC